MDGIDTRQGKHLNHGIHVILNDDTAVLLHERACAEEQCDRFSDCKGHWQDHRSIIHVSAIESTQHTCNALRKRLNDYSCRTDRAKQLLPQSMPRKPGMRLRSQRPCSAPGCTLEQNPLAETSTNPRKSRAKNRSIGGSRHRRRRLLCRAYERHSVQVIDTGREAEVTPEPRHRRTAYFSPATRLDRDIQSLRRSSHVGDRGQGANQSATCSNVQTKISF